MAGISRLSCVQFRFLNFVTRSRQSESFRNNSSLKVNGKIFVLNYYLILFISLSVYTSQFPLRFGLSLYLIFFYYFEKECGEHLGIVLSFGHTIAVN